MIRKLTIAACTTLLISCVSYSPDMPLTGESPSPTPRPQLPEVEIVPLPEEITERIKETYAEDQNVSVEQVKIQRYSREIWEDGCLGLGESDEFCLLALTEGWQVEAVDTTTGSSSQFYRTNLTGGQVRLSTLENNLPPSVRDRILQTLRTSGMATDNELSIVSTEPQVWDGCLGMAAENEVCEAIGILGWRVIATDTNSTWTYHTDGLGNKIALKAAPVSLYK